MSTFPINKGKIENDSLFADVIYRDILSRGIACILKDIGFTSSEKRAIDATVQIVASFLNEICESAKKLCDHSGRTEITLRDVQLSLDTMGIPIDEFCIMLKNMQVVPGTYLPELEKKVVPESPTTLKISEPCPHPPHMPCFLPPFPDPHTYVHTEVSGEVDSNYEKVRNISANNKRSIENSLISFALSTHPSISLFQEYEKTLLIEAKNSLEHAKLLKQHKIEERRMAKNAQRLKNDLATAHLHNTDILMEDLLQESNEIKNELDEDANTLKEIEQEELFELRDTEYSYVKKRIPEFLRILLPFDEDKAYLSALVTDENLDDDSNHFAKILSKEIEDELAAETTDDFDNTIQMNEDE